VLEPFTAKALLGDLNNFR